MRAPVGPEADFYEDTLGLEDWPDDVRPGGSGASPSRPPLWQQAAASPAPGVHAVPPADVLPGVTQSSGSLPSTGPGVMQAGGPLPATAPGVASDGGRPAQAADALRGVAPGSGPLGAAAPGITQAGAAHVTQAGAAHVTQAGAAHVTQAGAAHVTQAGAAHR
ncbi:hypothetical protein ACIBO8_02680, partial [Actinoplanes sp. NPDC049681]